MVYSCLDCNNTGLGVCYGCFVSCHTQHRIVELDYQRDFQCECIECHLDTEKQPTSNTKGPRFVGLFCYCLKPYLETQEMVQCFVCCDWYHSECVQTMPEEHQEFVCARCSSKHPYLKHWFSGGCCNDFTPSVDEMRVSSRGCTCQDCQTLFIAKNLEFLIEDVKTSPAKDTPTDLDTLLTSMDRTKQMDCIEAYQTLKQSMTAYFRPFAEAGKIVTEQDVAKFFESMKS
ncbi:hypothetical protein EDD86DRAFT_244846 [Gorgonomyces haynaldii]|nr:hypothetical protein EDD86DRAFT_244846 [Gorgonomyces haynaldii]